MSRFEIVTVLIVAVVFGGLLVTFERARVANRNAGAANVRSGSGATSSNRWPLDPDGAIDRIAAPGRIEGITETVEIRPRLSEAVIEVLVEDGDWVGEGDLLVRLDPDRFEAERKLAAAELRRAEADLRKLRNGARESEVDELRGLRDAALADLEGAEKSYARILRLEQGRAASGQTVDDHAARLKSARAAVEVAAARLTTIASPPRAEEVDAAEAVRDAARSRLELTEVAIARTEIRAPTDGQVLLVNARAGELTRPDQPEPLIHFADTSRIRVRAEVDEFDALRVAVGLPAIVRCDSMPGKRVAGDVVRVGPRVHRKGMFEDRPGGRLDAYLRDVWIELEPGPRLPVGLPVDVLIGLDRGPSDADGKEISTPGTDPSPQPSSQ